MASLNQVNLIGNVGKDPEVKQITQSSKVAEFTLATSRRYTGADGQSKEETEWHSIVVFVPSLVDVAGKFIRKGSQIYVGGRLRTREWADQSGAKHYKTEIVAETIQLLGSKGENASAGGRQSAQADRPLYEQYARPQASAPAPAPVAETAPASAAEYDDLPF